MTFGEVVRTERMKKGLTQEKLGEDFMNKTIAKVTKDLTHYTLSDAQLAKVRIELGNALEAAAKN